MGLRAPGRRVHAPRAASLAVVGLLALVAPAPAAAQGFLPPVNLSNDGGSSLLPTVAVEQAGPGAGTARVFWHDFTSSPNLLWCAEETAGSWSPGALCGPNASASWSPRAVADASGRIHLAWRDRTAGQDDILYAVWDGSAWSAPVNVSATPGASRNPTLAVDPAGLPHVVWEEDPGTGSVRFYDAHFDGSAWSAAADTGLPDVAAAFLDTIRIACDGGGTLHAVWQDGATSVTEVYHAARPPGGPWGAPESVSGSPAELSAEPAIAVGPGDVLHCAWVEQDTGAGTTFEVVYATKPPAGSWSAPLDVSRQAASAYRPALAVHPGDGVARIAWGLNNPGEVWFVAAPGAVPVNVSLTPASTSERVALALDPAGEAFVAWHEKLGANWEVFAATTRAAPTASVLFAVKGRGRPDVELTWTGGTPPFAVGRSVVPDVGLGWNELTPPGGIAGRAFTDAGILLDGVTDYYGVRAP